MFSVESHLRMEKSPRAVGYWTTTNVITEHMLSGVRTAVMANCDVIWKLGHGQLRKRVYTADQTRQNWSVANI